MKINVGSHPDLPFPFSNGPEPPPDAVKALTEPLKLASKRHDEGVRALSALVNYWMGRSSLTHNQLAAIAAWGMGEANVIDKAVLSRIRNGLQPRGAGIRHLDALAGANRAIWLWQTGGQSAAWAELGPHGGWGITNRTLDDAIWLPQDPDSSKPLELSDFVDLLAGYLDLPYLTTTMLSPAEARRMSDALSRLLEELIVDQGWGPREGISRLLEAYPVIDTARQRRLRELIVGDQQLSREEIETELAALAEMIRVTRELRVGSYGPAELQAELSSESRPAS